MARNHVPPPNQSPHLILLHKFLNNPTSLFEHKIFTTLSVIMRNLTEQIQDYGNSYYTNYADPHQHGFFNASVVLLDHETDEIATTPGKEIATLFWVLPLITRILLTVLCVITATYFLNRRLLKNRTLQFALELIVCHMIIFPILPFVALFFGTIGLIRLGIYMHIQLFHRGKRFLVAPEDGFWAYEEYASSSCSNAVYVIQGKCDMKRILEKVKSTVSHPVVKDRMRRRLRNFCGFAIWEIVDKFNVKNHVRVAKWPKSDKRNGSAWTDKDVLDYLTTFQDTPMRTDSPAWEVVVVPDVKSSENNKPHYCCIFRMHHAMMDGISSANILHEALGDKPFKFTIDPVTDNAHRRPGKLMTLALYFVALVLLPRTGLINGLLGLDNFNNKYFSPGKMLKGPKHFSWSRPLKMDGIKKIKDSSKSSVMTVLLSGLGGSYRKMVMERKSKKSKKLPEFFHALAPVAMLPYPDRHPRNGFSGCSLPVAVGQYKTPQDRLRRNHAEFKKLSLGAMEILGNFMLIGMVGLMPTRLQRFFQRSVHFKMSLSNIPGSDEQITIFGGDQIIEMGAWLPCKFTLGMAMGLFSYAGRCRATFVGDSTYLSKSDVQSIVTNFETEILELGKSLGLSENELFY